MAKRKSAGKKTSSPADDGPAAEIKRRTAEFCREHLNEEYASACLRLAEKLARKRPSPLASGLPKTWACGIVRTIGWVNFLDDSTTLPHLKMTEIDRIFGVAQSTGQGKSAAIRKLFKIRMFSPEWTLPSRLDKNPLVWMIRVNGFDVDARYVRREIQEEAFRLGLIPYIPETRSAPADDA